ncbi:MAG: hypothetical protein ACRDOO_05530 [Actinomadura sp.]
MARGHRQIRTVAVRLRCVAFAGVRSPGVRRLLVIAGIAVAGWLLGGAGQAHAEALPGPAADASGAVLGTAAELTGGTGATSGGASVPGVSSVPRKVTGDLTRSLCAVRCAYPVRPSTVLDPPSDIERIATELAPALDWSERTDPGVSWTPRRHHGVDADAADRSGAKSPRPRAASGASKADRMVETAAVAHPAPTPGRDLPRPHAPQAGAFLPVAGSTLFGGGLADLPRTGFVTRVPLIRVPMPAAVPPAIHSAADEPSFSPD